MTIVTSFLLHCHYFHFSLSLACILRMYDQVCARERKSAVIKIGRIIHQSSNEWRVLPWETAVLIAFGVCLACHSCRNWLILVLLP